MKKTKLQNILNRLQGNDPEVIKGFDAFDNGVKQLKSDLEEKIRISTLNEVNDKLSGFQKRIDFEPLLSAFSELKTELETRDTEKDNEIRAELETKLAEVTKSLEDRDAKSEEQLATIYKEGSDIQSQLLDLQRRKPPTIPDFNIPLNEAETRLNDLIQAVKTEIEGKDRSEELLGLIGELSESSKKLRSDFASLASRGGSMNRQILIGNVNPLTRYTDINLKAGANVTLTYADNNQTKKVDVTIASSGGGGGSTRSINNISGDTTAGATAGTDYVYLCTGTLTLTLPTAVGNTNLYTVKNVGTGVVTVATTSAQTIDNDSSVIMPVRYTSVDVISDTANWSIT